ncbi:hypothetical protein CKM354_001216400 [Cercospora kikuchii]|uniref:Uncharacterized protein n=1 Tax=Cercospora kikuchii TaxID=84275 RepID=A0A9P3FLG8_9PEZI|nr:uncharacterized protein CKM354_001216400 [Cercospora kikuchii]GIZ49127.1 hypothetical protein CKM354_001216400 [Cercospora kikuchii]
MKLLPTSIGSLLVAVFASLPQPSLSRAILSPSIPHKHDDFPYKHYAPMHVSHGSGVEVLSDSSDAESTSLVHRALPKLGGSGRPPASPEPLHPPPMPARPAAGTSQGSSAGGTNRPPGVAGPVGEPGAAGRPSATDHTGPETSGPPKSTSSPLDWANSVSNPVGNGAGDESKDEDTEAFCTKQTSTTESQALLLPKLWQFFQDIKIAGFLWNSDKTMSQPTQPLKGNCTSWQ